MHPAYSVIFFTTASGAGYGLLIWLALFRMLGIIPPERWLGLVGLGLALTLISLGLLSSTAHLGHPERAWRAVTQWRSSWLSREGVVALVTYIPAGLLGIGWVFFELSGVVMGLLALLAIISALVTIWCTGMIYASLRTIRQWHQPLTSPIYVVLALATGGLLYNGLVVVSGHGHLHGAVVASLAIATALALKWLYWRSIDSDQGAYTAESATGLGTLGKVRPLDPPHTSANFVMHEMGYQVGRKHTAILRGLTILLCFVGPLAALFVDVIGGTAVAVAASPAAATSGALGVIIERWLFFAEAEHVVMLYYGADRA
ncbi:MAG: dimethyl sulfoxide reductase anchor subunit family protein [Methyloligellaceae bacterium]